MPGPIDDLDRVANADFVLLGVILIHHHIVRTFERAALNELETAAHLVEGREIDTGDVVKQIGAIGKDSARHLDVRNLVDYRWNDLRQHLSAGNDNGAARRA